MEDVKLWIAAVAGTVPAYLAWITYPGVGLGTALLVLLLSSWLIYMIISPGRAVRFLGYLLYPPIAGFIGFSVSFIWLTVENVQSPLLYLGTFAATLLSIGLSIWFNRIWNMG